MIGMTRLFTYLACKTQGSCVETISLLIQAYPEALTKISTYGMTPLRLALICLDLLSPEIIPLLLDRSPIEVLGMRDDSGWTYAACYYGRVSIDIIRQMIRLYRKALRFGRTNKSPHLQRAKNYRMNLQHLVTSARQLVWSSRMMSHHLSYRPYELTVESL
jgi:hypothetical protein